MARYRISKDADLAKSHLIRMPVSGQWSASGLASMAQEAHEDTTTAEEKKASCAQRFATTTFCNFLQQTQVHLALRNQPNFTGWVGEPGEDTVFKFRYEVKPAGGDISKGGKGLGVFTRQHIKEGDVLECADMYDSSYIWVP